ncbi:hypothetical protein KIN20_024690 [Parelaphostrongylus tenuis]|uniref:Uncharacterized protein n=1 Tax=Parelaphostrongylus tenuis TaxID=148309 RepID=A0AAD5MXB6_PARTN|nr:hypothetical protein KIN20_024690 [Parelaphostrongylus tenuis]
MHPMFEGASSQYCSSATVKRPFIASLNQIRFNARTSADTVTPNKILRVRDLLVSIEICESELAKK